MSAESTLDVLRAENERLREQLRLTHIDATNNEAERNEAVALLAEKEANCYAESCKKNDLEAELRILRPAARQMFEELTICEEWMMEKCLGRTDAWTLNDAVERGFKAWVTYAKHYDSLEERLAPGCARPLRDVEGR